MVGLFLRKEVNAYETARPYIELLSTTKVVLIEQPHIRSEKCKLSEISKLPKMP